MAAAEGGRASRVGGLILERARPPTLEKLRELVAGGRNRVVHFMGHGGQDEDGAVLLFEDDVGGAEPKSAREVVRRLRGAVFLVTLNACESATPGATNFANLAGALVRHGVPYALGMRFSIFDGDARAFARSFYGELARGVPVEDALLQARLTLAGSPRSWAVGVPVLYTALTDPAPGFRRVEGTPRIEEHQPLLELGALPQVEGVFQGRERELKALGRLLVGDTRPRLITIHGGGGQGKTALARVAAERFAHAWPGGVFAVSLESLPTPELLVADLARFLGIPAEGITDPRELERQVLARLHGQRTLLVLDNAETLLVEAEGGNAEAQALAAFLRERLQGALTTLLVTSRHHLGWPGEEAFDLEGLTPEAGAALFIQCAPQRAEAIQPAAARALSERVAGHPLSLRLLGSTFNRISTSLPEFVAEYEQHLRTAEDRFREAGHRQRSLYASIEISVRHLDEALRALLGKLWLFHAPFLPEVAAEILDPESEWEGAQSPIYDQLHTLWQRGLLSRHLVTTTDGPLLFYRLLPVMRPYVEEVLARAEERLALLARFGAAYARLAALLNRELGRGARVAEIARQAREDLERGLEQVEERERGWYLLHWGWVAGRLGDRRRALDLTEQALALAQGTDRVLESQALTNMALVYQNTGRPAEALALYEQVLPIMREVGSRAGEAATLNNIAGVYRDTGQPARALALYEQALPIMREVGNRASEATTLNNMAAVYQATGQPPKALELYEQILPTMREVGDRDGEAAALNNMGLACDATGQPARALALYEQALPILREVGNRAGEAGALANLAIFLYGTLERPAEAIARMEEALGVLAATGLPPDRGGPYGCRTGAGAGDDAAGCAARLGGRRGAGVRGDPR